VLEPLFLRGKTVPSEHDSTHFAHYSEELSPPT
jgi:hypothetical protein